MAKHGGRFRHAVAIDSGLKFDRKWFMSRTRELKAAIKKPAGLFKKKAVSLAKRSVKFAKKDLNDALKRVERDRTIDKVSRFIDSLKS